MKINKAVFTMRIIPEMNNPDFIENPFIVDFV